MFQNTFNNCLTAASETGLVSYIPVNEGAGTVLTDRINGNVSTMSGGPLVAWQNNGGGVHPKHQFATRYQYNSYNQVVSQTTPDAYSSNKPKAYLNWILLDEQFKLVSTGSGAEQVPDELVFGNPPHNQVHEHVKSNMPVTKNGYLYIFVSNETPNLNVYFDNLQVTHIRGPLLEETHYYPFGLTMAGISSRALNNAIENRYKFNGGTEFNSTFDVNLYETFFRSYDPQIGRFHQIDPLTENTSSWSAYSFVQNNPLLYLDPLGLDTVRNRKNPVVLPEVIVDRPPSYQGGYWWQSGTPVYGQPGSLPTGPGAEAEQRLLDALEELERISVKKETKGGGQKYGIGMQFSVGIGLGKQGTALTVGSFGTPGTVGQLFFTVSKPSKITNDFIFDYSGSSQLLLGYSKKDNFDFSGKGSSVGYGWEPLSFSYSTDDINNPTFHIIGVGPSLGVKYSGSYMETKTYSMPAYIPMVFGGLSIF